MERFIIYTNLFTDSTDMSLLKCLYLATMNISKKWDQAYRNWGSILS